MLAVTEKSIAAKRVKYFYDNVCFAKTKREVRLSSKPWFESGIYRCFGEILMALKGDGSGTEAQNHRRGFYRSIYEAYVARDF